MIILKKEFCHVKHRLHQKNEGESNKKLSYIKCLHALHRLDQEASNLKIAVPEHMQVRVLSWSNLWFHTNQINCKPSSTKI